MRAGNRPWIMGASLLLGSLWLGSPRIAHAQQTAISGQVVDATDGTPLEAAQVVLTGTNRIESTN